MILSEIDTLESGGIIINPKVSCIARWAKCYSMKYYWSWNLGKITGSVFKDEDQYTRILNTLQMWSFWFWLSWWCLFLIQYYSLYLDGRIVSCHSYCGWKYLRYLLKQETVWLCPTDLLTHVHLSTQGLCPQKVWSLHGMIVRKRCTMVVAAVALDFYGLFSWRTFGEGVGFTLSCHCWLLELASWTRACFTQ